jgi:hypothetical protein
MDRSADFDNLRLRFQSVKRQWRRARAEVERAGEALGARAPRRDNVIDMAPPSALRTIQRFALQVVAALLAVLATIGATTVLLQLAALWLVLTRGLGIRLVPGGVS